MTEAPVVEAVAASVKLAEAVKVLLFAGLVMEIVGGVEAAAFTLIVPV